MNLSYGRSRGSLAAAVMLAAALGDRGGPNMVTAGPPIPELPPGWHRGHGMRRGNKAPRDYIHEKRRRQIARASRQLNRRRSA